MVQRSLFHPVFTLWVPALFFILQVAMEVFVPSGLMSRLVSENGPHELAQFCLATAASVMALRCIILSPVRRDIFLLFWIGAFALGCFYIAAEEISWGQSFFAWGTPEFWAGINDQQETNLHNVSTWLDQKPKALVLIGIFIGGFVFPLLEKYTNVRLPERFRKIYPPLSMIFITLCIMAVKLSDLVDEQLPGVSFWTRDSEIEELYIFYYLLLYMIQMRGKILGKA